jgi:hypothetical protein
LHRSGHAQQGEAEGDRQHSFLNSALHYGIYRIYCRTRIEYGAYLVLGYYSCS